MKLPDQILVGFGTEISLHPVLSRCHSFFLFLFFSFLFFFFCVTFFLTETIHALQEPNLHKQVNSSLQEIILIKNPFNWDLYSAENLFYVLSSQIKPYKKLCFHFLFSCVSSIHSSSHWKMTLRYHWYFLLRHSTLGFSINSLTL